MAKEITIVYGKEIRLTTSKEKQKEIFVKFSTAFREKQLKELKGAPLSVFLCYALHSDEGGYTWVDDRLIKKETGYTITTEIRTKLVKKGYLFQERLRNDKGQVKDYIYRIFQPVEPCKKFIIRGEMLYTPTQEKPCSGENPVQVKDGGVLEEEPIKYKEEPSLDKSKDLSSKKSEFSFKRELDKLKTNKRRDLQVIALYWSEKSYKFGNYEQFQSALKRELRPAKKLVGYTDERIIEVMGWLETCTNFKWTLETCHKFIDEDLDEIEPFNKKGRSKY